MACPPFGAPPYAPRKIRIVPEFESGEIDLVPRRFGKVDAGESYVNVFIGRITPPCVPCVLALCREINKEDLDMFVGLHFGGRPIL